MSQYPETISTFRPKLNIPGMTYDPDKKTTVYVEDFGKLEEELQAVEETVGVTLIKVMPVGSLYFNISSDDNPADLGMQGTWVLEQEGFIPDPENEAHDGLEAIAYAWKRTE